jgi:hypothetical protein
VVGFVTKPLSGALDLLSSTSQSIANRYSIDEAPSRRVSFISPIDRLHARRVRTALLWHEQFDVSVVTKLSTDYVTRKSKLSFGSFSGQIVSCQTARSSYFLPSEQMGLAQ